jgi:hypothetical protein
MYEESSYSFMQFLRFLRGKKQNRNKHVAVLVLGGILS